MNTAFAFLLLFLNSCRGYLTDIPDTPASVLHKRIANGYTIQAGQAPYAASLELSRPDGSTQQCGATIISSTFLLTAAHCIVAPSVPFNSSVSIKVGYNSESTSSQEAASVENVYVHPQYLVNNVANASYDIAVIQVAQMTGSDTQRIPIYAGPIMANQQIVATGWGITGVASDKSIEANLQGAKLKVGSNSDCKGFDSDFGTSNGTLVCTLSKLSNGAGVCSGDAGTPAYTTSGGEAMLVGLASRIITTDGNFCGGLNSATMFVHTSYHMDYIVGVTGLSQSYLEGTTDMSNNASPTATGVRAIVPDATTTAKSHSSTSTVFVSETFVKYYVPL